MFATRPLEQTSPPGGAIGDLVREALSQLIADLVRALPNVVAGIVFLVLAAVLVAVVTAALRWVLARSFPDEPVVYRQFVLVIVVGFLWFGVVLAFLSVVGLEHVAASLGSAAAFLALGVSYALSSMIADAVAGVYLLRDPDFNPGDRVDVGGTVGTVESIELRKTRLSVDGDVVVRANAEIEKKWTKLGPEDGAAEVAPASGDDGDVDDEEADNGADGEAGDAAAEDDDDGATEGTDDAPDEDASDASDAA